MAGDGDAGVDRDAGVDPRFDPVFQRGYDPGRHRTRVRRPLESAPAIPSQPKEPVPQQPAQPESPPAAAADVPESTPERDEYHPPRRNPFRLALLLGSLAAIAGAALVMWRRVSQDPYGGYGGYGGDTATVFFQQFSDALFGPLLTGGLLGLCLWIAIGALRSRDHD